MRRSSSSLSIEPDHRSPSSPCHQGSRPMRTAGDPAKRAKRAPRAQHSAGSKALGRRDGTQPSRRHAARPWRSQAELRPVRRAPKGAARRRNASLRASRANEVSEARPHGEVLDSPAQHVNLHRRVALTDMPADVSVPDADFGTSPPVRRCESASVMSFGPTGKTTAPVANQAAS